MKQPMGGAVDYPPDEVPNEYDDRNNDITESHSSVRMPNDYSEEIGPWLELDADLRPSYPTLPQFTPGKAVMARTLLVAQSKLLAEEVMAKATAVSRIAEKGLRVIEQELIRRGFRKATVQNRAFYTTTFMKENEDGKGADHVFQVMGWHGTGRFAGGEKTVLEFYDEDWSETKPVVSIGAINESNINPAKQQEVIQHILDYIKHTG